MASPRARVAIALMAMSGLRPESIGNFNGTDGIRIGDLKEARITDQGLEFEKIPSILVIRANLNKSRHQYFTFVCKEATLYINEYISERISRGVNLNRDSPLLSFDPRGIKKNSFLRTSLVTRDVREAMRKAGFLWRPYVLRAYCDTAFDIAESKGLISHSWRMFFMRHKGDIEARYSTNKGRLPPEMIEEMRQSYSRCERYLSTIVEEEELREERLKRAFKEQFLVIAGFSKGEIDKMNIDDMTDEQLQTIIRQKLSSMMLSDESRQKIVPINDMKDYISKGYEFVATLPNGDAIVKLPF
jgi:hypothetical protein